jgi:hypothetical protein
MTAVRRRNSFAPARHRLSLWTAIKKLIGRGADRGGGKAAAPHARSCSALALLFDNSAKFDYP